MNQDLQKISSDAAKLADKKILQPAAAFAHDAQEVISEQFDVAREALSREVDYAKDQAAYFRDRTARWISANPLTAVGIALLAGIALTSVRRSRHD